MPLSYCRLTRPWTLLEGNGAAGQRDGARTKVQAVTYGGSQSQITVGEDGHDQDAGSKLQTSTGMMSEHVRFACPQLCKPGLRDGMRRSRMPGAARWLDACAKRRAGNTGRCGSKKRHGVIVAGVLVWAAAYQKMRVRWAPPSATCCCCDAALFVSETFILPSRPAMTPLTASPCMTPFGSAAKQTMRESGTRWCSSVLVRGAAGRP